jgi:ATP-dependent RNA circularization protein (DNA/RNA ligase family)
MSNDKLIMSRIDKEDLFNEAMDEFHAYKTFLMNTEMFGKDDPYVIEERAKYEETEFKHRLKHFLHLAAKVNAAITTVSI